MIRLPLLLLMGLFSFVHLGAREPFVWSTLQPLPDPIGFAAPYSGVAGAALLVAGGANFPEGRPWDGARKICHDRIFALAEPEGSWREVGRLPRPLAYGVSFTLPEGVLAVGGSDAEEHVEDVFLVRFNGVEAVIEPGPRLPMPLANAAGVQVGEVLYVAGGQTSPTAAPTPRVFALSLREERAARTWREVDPLPGRGRMLSVAATLDGKLFVFGGVDLVPGENGGWTREYLREAWSYAPSTGWQRLADLPEPRAAAPSPAPAIGSSHAYVVGGDTGELATRVAELRDEHPGFTSGILVYHAITNTWAAAGEVPTALAGATGDRLQAPVTTTVVPWQGRLVIPTGEVRPGVRTPRVLVAQVQPERATLGWINGLTIAIYLGAMLGIGFYCSKRGGTTEAFFRGGQNLPWWAVGLSIYATMLSSITFMALPAKAYASDWSYLFANVAIVLVAPIVIAAYLPFFRRLNVTSAYEYLEARFNLGARLFGSLSFILFQIGRMAIVLYLPAIALATVSSLDVYTCILLTAVLCIVYTMIGGIEAVVWTDVVQTVVLLGGALATLGLVIARTPEGWSGVWSIAQADAKLLQQAVWWSPNLATASIAIIVFGSFFNNLMSYTASQDVVQRYMTTADEGRAVRSIWTNAVLALPGTLLFFAVGTALYVFYRYNPERLDPAIATDQILPLFIVRELPAGLAGLVIAGIFAASQSTMSSSLNSVATAWVTDFHRRFRPHGSDAANLRLAKALILVVGIVVTAAACLMARLPVASLFDRFITVIGMTGGALAGLFALGIFTQRAHGRGAVVGAVASVVAVALVRQTSLTFFLYGAVGFLTCSIVGYVVSLLWPASRPSRLDGLTWWTLRDSSGSGRGRS